MILCILNKKWFILISTILAGWLATSTIVTTPTVTGIKVTGTIVLVQ